MGYTTTFDGEFDLDKPLAQEHKAYLNLFAHTRRMKRDPETTKEREDPIREAAGLPVGKEGEYFVGARGRFGQELEEFYHFEMRSLGVVEYNFPPAEQPGLWCQWVPNEDGTKICWDGNEKFYHYVEWLRYIVEHFLKPWGYTLNGVVTYQGELRNDFGTIKVINNQVTVL